MRGQTLADVVPTPTPEQVRVILGHLFGEQQTERSAA